MTTTAQTTAVPTGTWRSDPVHSSLGFAVTHMVVATFRGTMADFDATLTGREDGTATLEAAGRVASVVTGDEHLDAHIQAPDFFDGPRHPETRYASREIRREGDELVVDGELTIRGTSRPLTLRGTIVGPVLGMGDTERVGLHLEGVIDRTDFGLDWNAPIPGGGLVLGNEVRLTADLSLVPAS